MSSLYLFAASFITVFGLGFQSLNINQGHMKAAFWGSVVVGFSNLIVLRMIPETHSVADMFAYLLGGPLGVVSSMYVHRKTLGKKK